jgi:hypothetical protein
MFLILIIISYAIAGCEHPVTFTDEGYNYPAEIKPADSNFFWLPIRDSLSSLDSLHYTMNYVHYYKSWHEPNLSLRPMPEPVFRLSYDVMGATLYMIILMPEKLIVKEWKSGHSFPGKKTEILTQEERQHLHYFQRYYPWFKPEPNTTPSKNGYDKFLLSRYPQLNDVNYYIQLLKKSEDLGKENFVFTTRVTRISHETYSRLVNGINKSGFWTLPWKNFCEPMPMDGDGYMLEANTPKHFKVVVSSNCDSSSHIGKFLRTINDLKKEAGIKVKISYDDFKNRNWSMN